MQSELRRSIAITHDLLAICAPGASSKRADFEAQVIDVLEAVASIGLPRIDDSRIPHTLSTKLHNLTEEHFRAACLSLRSSPAASNPLSLQRLALSLKSTYMSLYERKIQDTAKARTQPKPLPRKKEPYANDILVYAFERSSTPTRREREVLASITGMTLEQVRVWFQNRRSRSKKKATEVQPRPALQLAELLERVKSARETTNASQQRGAEFDEDYDSGYYSSSENLIVDQWPTRRPAVQLATALTTPRSYPATYVPQPLTAQSHSNAPTWPRTPGRPVVHKSTVTVDELTRSMAQLSLRHRRQTPRTSTGSESNAMNSLNTNKSVAKDAATVLPTSTTKRKVARNPDTGRKVAGGRRVAPTPATSSSVTMMPLPASGTSTAHLCSSSPPDVPARERKKAGPPRRKPTGKVALSRQSSGASLSSTSSYSSRSASYASNISSSTSIASDISFTSPESDSPAHMHDCLKPLMLGQRSSSSDFDKSQWFAEQRSHIPVFDLTAMPFPDSEPACQLDALFGDPMMQDLLQNAQTHQPQEYISAFAASLSSIPSSVPQTFDIGVASMDSMIDFSLAPFPNLEALLSNDLGFLTGLSTAAMGPLDTSTTRSV